MIHFFHGQFDHPTIGNDYHFGDDKTKVHNLYELKIEDLLRIEINPEDILIGYSLGGRIALKIASQNNFNLKKLILLSCHPGLDLNEKKERLAWEEDILLRMRSNSMEDFLDFWNSLPLFSKSRDYRPLDEALFKKSINLFENNRLSNQPNFINEILHHKEKIIYIFGNEDKKYSDIAAKLQFKGIKTFGLDSDHRVHLHRKTIQEIIHREITT
jgi:2-succinyl-6-hydroxy-2,4-cyclohexadiene-1-carboxylate synthase